MKVLGIIPARFASTRLPAKPLADINGKTMIQWVWEATKNSKLDAVVVATDHYDIYTHCRDKGINVTLTSDGHVSGTDRVVEVSRKPEYAGYDIYVNIQGDEPMIKSDDINDLVDTMKAWSEYEDDKNLVGTLVAPFMEHELQSRSCVKAFRRYNNTEILMFTRSVFYHSSPIGPDTGRFNKHMGVYAFPKHILETISELKDRTINEIAESLEQLRWMDNGIHIAGVNTSNKTISIDTPEDLERVRQILK
jgi:3-deoxy-manno-octulosonate cytidylyltransferase (CMP-KDO synthetase)